MTLSLDEIVKECCKVCGICAFGNGAAGARDCSWLGPFPRSASSWLRFVWRTRRAVRQAQGTLRQPRLRL